MKGPIHFRCGFCGNDCCIFEYTESIKCNACNRELKFNEENKTWFRKHFPDRISYRPEPNEHELKIFDELGLSAEKRKYLNIEGNSIYFSFPLKMVMGEFSVGNKILVLDDVMTSVIFDKVCEAFEQPLIGQGFSVPEHSIMIMNEQSAVSDQLQFVKEFQDDEEAKSIIRWLVDYKKRNGV